MKCIAILAIAAFALASAEVYFEEDFSGDWESRWVQSKAKDGLGVMKVSAGKFYNDAEAGKGLQTSQDAKFYAISAKTKEFSNEGKTLVIQYSVKHEQDIDCGGGYLKIAPSDAQGEKFTGDSKYNIMFGPDICGSSTKKTHVIFNYKEKNLDKKTEVRAESDTLSHLYTLIVKPDNTYEVQIDMNKVDSGSLSEGWAFLEPKQIRDPDEKKPSDWAALPSLRIMSTSTSSPSRYCSIITSLTSLPSSPAGSEPWEVPWTSSTEQVRRTSRTFA